MLFFYSITALANHSFGGLDMCALYPEVMPPGLSRQQLPEPDTTGADLMVNYCTQCHELPGPGRHTASEWPMVLNNMFILMDVANQFGGLMGNIKAPNQTQRAQLQTYLEKHALKQITHTPTGTGANAYQQHCGSCHQLPDPAAYSPAQWQQIIKRMQRNMTIMKYPLPADNIMVQIQLFVLQNNTTNLVNADIKPASVNETKTHVAKNQLLSTGSLLALGPFVLLVITGLVRWWRSQHTKQDG